MKYVAAGGNLIDTADVYSEGVSEEIIGRWLSTHRTEVKQKVVATKDRFTMGVGPNDLGTSRRHLTRARGFSAVSPQRDPILPEQPKSPNLGFNVDSSVYRRISLRGRIL